jgi:hypothetical protein
MSIKSDKWIRRMAEQHKMMLIAGPLESMPCRILQGRDFT